MGAEQDFCCEAVRRRHAQHTSASHQSTKKQQKLNEIQQIKNSDEREKKIHNTDVTFYQFWCECIDWEMIKLFYALLMLFFSVVGFSCFIYLLFVFNFNENLWYFYFPVGKQYRERFWLEDHTMVTMGWWKFNTTLPQLAGSSRTINNVSVELIKSHNVAVYSLACLLAFLVFGLAYFIMFKWVAKGNLDMPRFQDVELAVQIRSRTVDRKNG